jgi:hypothetical protein
MPRMASRGHAQAMTNSRQSAYVNAYAGRIAVSQVKKRRRPSAPASATLLISTRLRRYPS